MTETTAKRRKEPSRETTAIAMRLFELSAGLFAEPKPKENSGYLTLDVGSGKNKNAVSVLKKGVSFMVADWSAQATSEEFGVGAVRTENSKIGKRLLFPKLNLATLTAHEAYFVSLLPAAKLEAERRQTSVARAKR